MATTSQEADLAAIAPIVAGLEHAWNRADGAAFAAEFAPNADFVHRYGGRLQGREAIAALHDAIFSGPYAGSVNRYDVESVRSITHDVAVAHVRAHLQVPSMDKTLEAVWLGVFSFDGQRWMIEAFHNTLVEPMPSLEKR